MSRVNKAMIQNVRDLPNITIHDLYERYPDFHINIEEEQLALLDKDLIVFHHPIYSYSHPSLLKEWTDRVLSYGFAFGKNKSALRDKHFMLAVSAAGRQESYHQDGINNFTLEEFLRPIEQTAYHCRMHYWKPFTIYGTPNLTDDQIQDHAKSYRELLLCVVNGQHVNLASPPHGRA